MLGDKKDSEGKNIPNSLDKNSPKGCDFNKDFWQVRRDITLEGSKGKFLGLPCQTGQYKILS